MTGARESPHANPSRARRRSHERPTAGPPSVGANGRRTPSRERCQSLGISTTAFELLPKAVRNTLQLLLLSADLASRFLLRVMAAAPGDRPAPPPCRNEGEGRRERNGGRQKPRQEVCWISWRAHPGLVMTALTVVRAWRAMTGIRAAGCASCSTPLSNAVQPI